MEHLDIGMVPAQPRKQTGEGDIWISVIPWGPQCSVLLICLCLVQLCQNISYVEIIFPILNQDEII